jgi:hypothetical protein
MSTNYLNGKLSLTEITTFGSWSNDPYVAEVYNLAHATDWDQKINVHLVNLFMVRFCKPNLSDKSKWFITKSGAMRAAKRWVAQNPPCD